MAELNAEKEQVLDDFILDCKSIVEDIMGATGDGYGIIGMPLKISENLKVVPTEETIEELRETILEMAHEEQPEEFEGEHETQVDNGLWRIIEDIYDEIEDEYDLVLDIYTGKSYQPAELETYSDGRFVQDFYDYLLNGANGDYTTLAKVYDTANAYPIELADGTLTKVFSQTNVDKPVDELKKDLDEIIEDANNQLNRLEREFDKMYERTENGVNDWYNRISDNSRIYKETMAY